MTTLSDLERLARAATIAHHHVPDPVSDGAFYEPCEACEAIRDLHRALSPERVLALIECVRAADAMRKNLDCGWSETAMDPVEHSHYCARCDNVTDRNGTTRIAFDAALEGDK